MGNVVVVEVAITDVGSWLVVTGDIGGVGDDVFVLPARVRPGGRWGSGSAVIEDKQRVQDDLRRRAESRV